MKATPYNSREIFGCCVIGNILTNSSSLAEGQLRQKLALALAYSGVHAMLDIEVLSPLSARFLAADAPLYGPEELAIFQTAYDEACRALGLDPMARDGADGLGQVRSRVAGAVLDKGRCGERSVLSAFAVAHGLRHWPLT
jgi:hypothetical protein